MAYTDYNNIRLIFDDVLLQNFVFKGANWALDLPKRVILEHQRRRSDGRVSRGDIFYNSAHHITYQPPQIAAEQLGKAFWVYFSNDNGNGAMAILAVPRRYGSVRYTNENGISNWWSDYINYMAEIDKDENSSYDYYLIVDNDGYEPRVGYNSMYSNAYVANCIASYPQYKLYAHQPDGNYVPYAISSTTQFPRRYATESSEFGAIGRVTYTFANGNGSNKRYFKDIVSVMGEVQAQIYETTATDVPMYSSLVKDRITAAIIVGQASDYAPIVNRLRVYPLITYGLQAGSTLATSFPVFTINTIQSMFKYFAGEEYESANDINLPPTDWSTDWDIYVKGAQKPEIFITMKSDKVDTWLANLGENTSGATKEDIAVEYRYREYKLDAGGNMGSVPKYLNSFIEKPLLPDRYNNTKETSYSANVELNYPLIDSIAGGLSNGEFSDYNITNLYDYYAELGFRITYGKYMSAWCYYKVGVIGSPSVEDFSKMENEGGQDDAFQDNSTVTLHYDEYPEGYNPYPDRPNPDMPPITGTDPSKVPVGLNGIGLLSTTYKITQAQAEALGRFFWKGDIFQKIKALNTSPIENVVGITIMPIDISGTDEVVVIGDVDTKINGEKIVDVPLYTIGSVSFKGRYGSFLDYEPYTSAFIFLPFVGFVQIDPAYFTNHTLKVTYSYDIINGVCNAMLFSDNIYVESHQGRCGIEVPLVASNRAELVIGTATSLVHTGASAMNSKMPLVSATVGETTALGDFINGFHSSRQGGYSPSCAWTETRQCFIVIESANASYSSTYNHDSGRPCNASYNIGSLSGYTEVDPSVDLSGISGATQEELDIIRSILTTGFYA